MLPNVLPHTEADHVPVLAARVRELLAVQPGETVVLDGQLRLSPGARVSIKNAPGDAPAESNKTARGAAGFEVTRSN